MTSGTSPSALCVAVFKIPFATGNNKLRASYTLTMESFEENYDLATRQACSVLSGNDCKYLQRICANVPQKLIFQIPSQNHFAEPPLLGLDLGAAQNDCDWFKEM